MRVSYKTYTYHDNEKIVSEDLGLWLKAWLSDRGIENRLQKVTELAILFTEDMLANHPERIGMVAEIIEAVVIEHKMIAEEEANEC